MKVEKKPGQVSQSLSEKWAGIVIAVMKILFLFFNPRQLAKIKIEDDGSYVQLSEVNVNDKMTVLISKNSDERIFNNVVPANHNLTYRISSNSSRPSINRLPRIIAPLWPEYLK